MKYQYKIYHTIDNPSEQKHNGWHQVYYKRKGFLSFLCSWRYLGLEYTQEKCHQRIEQKENSVGFEKVRKLVEIIK